MVGFILGLIVVGLIAGFIARLLLPGRDPMSVGMTILLGMVGSFVGGFIGWALFGHDLSDGAIQKSGWFGSIVGSVIVLAIYRATHRSQRGVGRRHSHLGL
ncbi:MAG: hypothetical protein JWL70_207 [Acidimicrobiia bacterium]|nr:hypothetical protein [Acidimicrobiia bacterium]